MQKLFVLVITLLAVSTVGFSQSMAKKAMSDHSAQVIKLDQVDGEFVVQSLTLKPGTYQFEISNTNVDHEVGFVLAPEGKPEQQHHIKNAYVKAPVKTGSSSLTNEVTLAKGEYIYFCPLNPTPQYKLTVE